MESALTISPLNLRASLTASLVLPLAVGPKITIIFFELSIIRLDHFIKTPEKQNSLAPITLTFAKSPARQAGRPAANLISLPVAVWPNHSPVFVLPFTRTRAACPIYFLLLAKEVWRKILSSCLARLSFSSLGTLSFNLAAAVPGLG